MIPAPPSLDQLEPDPSQNAVVARKSRSSKQFFLASAGWLGIGLGVIGVVGVVAWLARNQLAATSLSAFLRSKGVPADITIENLQLDTAQIRGLRLGPADRPSLIAKNTIIKWRVDSKARLFIIERLQIDGVTLRMAIGADGKPDFGALTPFMKPTTGPKRSVIDNVTLSNATLLLDTPDGQAQAQLAARGGESTGWTGRADVTPPASMIAQAKATTVPFVPMRIGFALAQRPANGPANSLANVLGQKAATLIGFSARPTGQNLAYKGFQVLGLAGDVTGLVTLVENGSLRIDTRPANLASTRILGTGIDVAGLKFVTSNIFWTHAQPWQTTGWGNIVATGSFANLQLASAKFKTGATEFRLGAARADSGRMQVDFQTNVQSVSGPLVGQRIALAGNVTTIVRDLTQLGKASFAGKSQVSGSGMRLPAALMSNLPATLPPAIELATRRAFSGSGTFDYQITPTGSQIALAGPLALTGETGMRASLVPQGRGAPTLLLKAKPDGSYDLSGLVSGRASFALPGLADVQGDIDGATFGPNGWAMIGRDLTLRSLARTPAVAATLRFDSLNLQGPKSGAFNGRGTGQIAIIGAPTGSALLGFDLRATPTTVSGSVQGPFNGFGSALGLGGYGARGGTIAVTGTGARIGQIWTLDARGKLAAYALATNAISLTASNLSLGLTGRLSDQGILNARMQMSGTATNARPASANNRVAFGGLTLDGNANLSGKLDNLTVAGNLAGSLGRATVSGAQIEKGQTSLQFAGTISPSSAQLRGSSVVNLASAKSQRNGPDGQVSVSGVQAAGPFSFGAIATGNKPAFWDGRLTLTSDMRASVERLQSGTTRLSGLDVSVPVSAALSQDKAWTAQGSLLGQADLAILAGTTFTDLQVTAPFNARSTSNGWQSGSDLSLTARTLVSGDTRLNGLTAKGPLGLAGSANGDLRLSSARCLAFTARSGTFPGDAGVGPVEGKLCPDNNGQLALISQGTPRFSATTQLEPLSIQMGGVDGEQRIEIGEVNGTLTTKSNGGLNLAMLATQFGLSMKMPDGTTAIIKANEAALDIIPRADGIGLEGRLGRVSSTGLPVFLSGGATTQMVAGARGLVGTFNFDDIIVKDAEKSIRFGEMRLVGGGTLNGNQVSILSDVIEPASEIKMAAITLSHDIRTGSGNLDVTAKDVLMSPTPVQGRPGLDIVTLIPPLRGVVLDMVGVVNASANIAWSRLTPIASRAHVETKGLDFGTMLGPVTGFAGDVRLDDLLLVRTPGQQTIKIGLFDPGLPIADGTVQFTLPGNNSLRLEDASWPFAEGKLSVRPATWAFRDGDQAFAIDVENVDLAKLLRLTDVPNLEIDGKVSGVFPIEVRGGNVEIVGGRLRAREGGGVIRYTGPNPAPPPPPPGFIARMRQRLLGKPPPAGADLAIEALRALEYKILEITVDGRITGELQMGVILEGANQQVLSGQPFKFNIKMNVPIGQLMENLNRLNNAGSSPEVLKEIDRVMREDAASPAPVSTPPAAPSPPPIPAP